MIVDIHLSIDTKSSLYSHIRNIQELVALYYSIFCSSIALIHIITIIFSCSFILTKFLLDSKLDHYFLSENDLPVNCSQKKLIFVVGLFVWMEFEN